MWGSQWPLDVELWIVMVLYPKASDASDCQSAVCVRLRMMFLTAIRDGLVR